MAFVDEALQITIEDPDVDPVLLEGEIDLTTAPRLRSALLGLVEAGHKHLVVDVSGVTFIDSTGLTAPVAVHGAVEEGGSRRLRSPGVMAMRVLSTAGVDQLIPVEHPQQGSPPSS